MKLQKILTLLTLLSLALLTISGQARIKCWTNDEGVRECGDKIPPEYSQKKHEVITEQGLVVEEKERALTEEEIAEQKRLAAIQAEKERKAAEKKRKDMILLQTFSKVEDIERARDDKLAAIETTISLAEKRNEKIQEDLDKRIEQAAAKEREGKEPSKELLEDITELRKQIKTNNEFIEERRKEQEKVKAAYAKDIERFKELKSEESSETETAETETAEVD